MKHNKILFLLTSYILQWDVLWTSFYTVIQKVRVLPSNGFSPSFVFIHKMKKAKHEEGTPAANLLGLEVIPITPIYILLKRVSYNSHRNARGLRGTA